MGFGSLVDISKGNINLGLIIKNFTKQNFCTKFLIGFDEQSFLMGPNFLKGREFL